MYPKKQRTQLPIIGGIFILLGSILSIYATLNSYYEMGRAILTLNAANFHSIQDISAVLTAALIPGLFAGFSAITRKSWHWSIYLGSLSLVVAFFSVFAIGQPNILVGAASLILGVICVLVSKDGFS